MRAAFGVAVAHLAAKLGGTPGGWTWARLHTRYFPSVSGAAGLGYGPRVSSGDAWTVDAAEGGLQSSIGPSWRMIVDFSGAGSASGGGPSLAEGVYPGGQSENPASPWYANLIADWWDNRYLPMASTGSAGAGSVRWSLRPARPGGWRPGPAPGPVRGPAIAAVARPDGRVAVADLRKLGKRGSYRLGARRLDSGGSPRWSGSKGRAAPAPHAPHARMFRPPPARTRFGPGWLSSWPEPSSSRSRRSSGCGSCRSSPGWWPRRRPPGRLAAALGAAGHHRNGRRGGGGFRRCGRPRAASPPVRPRGSSPRWLGFLRTRRSALSSRYWWPSCRPSSACGSAARSRHRVGSR